MLSLDRTHRERPHLEWKVRLFAVAAVVGLAGIHFDNRWLTGAAILILFAGLSLRFVRSTSHGEPEDDDEG